LLLWKALSWYKVVLFQQDAENRCFLFNFSAGGLHDWGILLAISLEFQEIKHQPFLWHSVVEDRIGRMGWPSPQVPPAVRLGWRLRTAHLNAEYF